MKDKHNKQFWLDLQQKYFEALTTDEEEQLLKQFVSSTDDDDFNETKAVMGYAATKKTIQKKEIHIYKSLRYAVAAVLVLAIGLSTTMIFDSNPDCIAYVGGKKVTDKVEIEKLVSHTMQDMQTKSIAETQLEEVFNIPE